MEKAKESVIKAKNKRFVIKKKFSKVINRSGVKSKGYSKSRRGVIFVKHVPHGFYEPQMKRYFEQFGHVTRIRLSRSKKTGRSKGYAFVEFADDNVARITADAMKDYLMFRHRMICQYIPRNEVHRDTFKRWNCPFKKPRAHLAAIRRHNKIDSDPKREEKRALKGLKRNARSLEKIKKLGVDYELE